MGCDCGSLNCSGNCGCTNANVGQIILQPAGVRPCSPLAGTCGSSACSTPEPYYNSEPQCQENHCQQIITNNFASAICVRYAFNIPDCGETANIYFEGVTILPVGAYLWHETYGYLEIAAFNKQTGLATVINHCNDDNAPVGTNIPACTCFVVTDPPQEDQINPFTPYVAEDFTAPANGNCTTISVTTTSGLIIGGSIQIGSGTYTLDEINNPTTIVICNEGEGITPGTVVEARNEAGQLQYPITGIATNACNETAVAAGAVLVCDGVATKPLDGAVVGQVLTLTDASTNAAAYALPGVVGGNEDTAEEAITLSPAETDFTEIITVNITNTHPTKAMPIMFVVDMSFEKTISENTFNYGIELQVNGGGYIDMARLAEATLTAGSFGTEAKQVVGHYTHSLAPLGVLVINFRGFGTNAAGASDVQMSGVILRANYFGVSV